MSYSVLIGFLFFNMEIWKTIDNFTNYEISNYGNVKKKKCNIIYTNGVITNYKEKILKQEVTKKKYKRVTLSQNNIQKRHQVHRLVANYFIINIENKPCVNHINGNGFNNHHENLEWVTYSENEQHSYNVLKKINPIRKLTNEDIIYIRLFGKKGKQGNVTELSKIYNVNVTTIYNVLKNKYYVSN